jgi:aminoglycoside/choline kinase family phosphotransferase
MEVSSKLVTNVSTKFHRFDTQTTEKDDIVGINLIRKGALPPPPHQSLCHALDAPSVAIEWLAGDGSDRCYYRLKPSNSARSLVLMQLSGRDAEALKRGGYEWIQMGNILQNNGVFVPKVIATLPDFAALIIEDYGDLMLEGLFKNLGESDAELTSRYETAVRIIGKFLRIAPDSTQIWCQRKFDEERFVWELNFLREKYLEPIAGIEFNSANAKAFEEDSRSLSRYLANYSKYFVHRDYHSRNLMVEKEVIAVLDFQDARLGPPGYDLVSLIFDSYVDLTQAKRLELLAFSRILITEKVGPKVCAEIEESWRATLLQRQWKAIGSFGYLTLEKNRGDYLKYVGPALKILQDNNVADSRWPYLSDGLVSSVLDYLSGPSNARN